jgi:hypothetical protein
MRWQLLAASGQVVDPTLMNDRGAHEAGPRGLYGYECWLSSSHVLSDNVAIASNLFNMLGVNVVVGSLTSETLTSYMLGKTGQPPQIAISKSHVAWVTLQALDYFSSTSRGLPANLDLCTLSFDSALLSRCTLVCCVVPFDHYVRSLKYLPLLVDCCSNLIGSGRFPTP